MKAFYKIIIINLLFLVSCGGGGSKGDEPSEPTPTVSPKAANLVFPENNKECTEGIVLSNSQSKVNFQWAASENTDRYELNLINLNTNTSSKINATTNEVIITLLRGTPYQWYVISKASGTTLTAESARWRFYNQGIGVESYSPFPAQVVSPKRGSTIAATTSVVLSWTGQDVDNDIKNYEVLFGTTSTPTTSLGVVTTNTTSTAVISGVVYYWIVLTTDNKGNTSKSELFEFKVG